MNLLRGFRVDPALEGAGVRVPADLHGQDPRPRVPPPAAQEGARRGPQAPALVAAQVAARQPARVPARRPVRAAHARQAAGLHLDEQQRVAALGEQVDLGLARDEPPRQHAHAALAQAPRDEVLTRRAELARVRPRVPQEVRGRGAAPGGAQEAAEATAEAARAAVTAAPGEARAERERRALASRRAVRRGVHTPVDRRARRRFATTSRVLPRR